MAKGAYIGVNNIARKIKKGYIGVNNVARKIKKAYIGIGGVARPCWSGGELSYYGPITALNNARYDGVAASNRNYALFAGGFVDSKPSNTVNGYDKSLSRISPTALPSGMTAYGASTVGDYAVFAGGAGNDMYSFAFNLSLSRTDLSFPTPRWRMGSATIGNYAIFAGGYNDGPKEAVTAYDTSLSLFTPTSLSQARQKLAGTANKKYALFGGGTKRYNECFDTVDAFNSSLTRSVPTPLNVARMQIAATHVGEYALFAGGECIDSTASALVEAYDGSLTKIIISSLSISNKGPAATTIGNYAIFGWGYNGDGYTLDVNVYDSSLVKTVINSLSVPRSRVMATAIGDYALFGGGYGQSGPSDVVEAFTIA